MIALCTLIVPGGGSSAITPTPTPVRATPGNVAVAFVGVPPPGNFTSVLLNVAGIRINKSPGADPAAPTWTTISVPTSSSVENPTSPGDLQLDLLNTQTGAVVLNVGGVPAGTYQTVQVLVDPNAPGTIVPACQSGISNTEGCINYKMQFNGASQNSVIFTLASPISVAANTTVPLVIQLAMSITSVPANTGDPYMVNITPTETNVGSFLATVTGSIKEKQSVTASPQHLTPLTVSAELSGTNTVIETVPVKAVKAKNVYTLELPAAPSGTSYDIFTNGGGESYATLQNITVLPGQFVPDQNLIVSAATTTAFEGLVADACTGTGIPGAQLQLLAPAQNATKLPTPRPTPPASFCLSNPQQCVVVASASADQNGDYPTSGTTKHPSGFGVVPLDEADLAVQVNASGYSSLLSSVFLKGRLNQLCSAGGSTTLCNFSLTTGYINGTVNLVSDPPPGSSLIVQVFGENSGTNQLVAALPQPLVFLNSETSLPFTLNVPISGAGPNFDLFAAAIDPFQGGPNPFPGHDIQVLANQPGPLSGCQQTTTAAFAPMNCVGHGSITGTVQNPDTGTGVEVEKQGVQITGTTPGRFSSVSPSNNQYTLCVPPDTYALQRIEAAPTSSATESPTPIPVGTPQAVVVPQPAATSSPCPSTCSNSDTGSEPCPGICGATAASPL